MEQLDNYEIIGKALKGGMGQVFHCKHLSWNVEFAMKQPLDKYLGNNDRKEMFISECEKMMSLDVHPHIVQCYYVGEMNGKMSVLMEWMRDGSLKEMIKNGSLYQKDNLTSLLKILDIALQVAIGLNYSHSKGLLHLDIKPENILIDHDVYKISDFGISNYLDSQNGKVFYTPLYCAPEQKEKGVLNETTDIYNYGVTLLHLLCGEAVWMDGVVVSKSYSTIIKKYSKVKCPHELLEVLDKCLQRHQRDRYQSFNQVIDQLINCWNQYSDTYYEQFPRYYDNDSTSMNHLGISYYNLNHRDKAKNYWYMAYKKYPYFIPSYYNYQLYNYLNDQIKYDAIEYSNQRHDYDENDSYHLYLLSRFYVSSHAYEKARSYALKSVKKALSNLDMYLNNEKYNQRRYQENGPKVINQLNLKNILKVDLPSDCVYLGMIRNDQIIYVSKLGKLTIIDLKNKKINHGNSGLKNIQNACMTYDGRYIALCHIDENKKQEDKVHHEIVVYDLKEDIIKKIMTMNGYYKKCHSMFFVNQENDVPTLVVRFENQLFDFTMSNEKIGVHQSFQYVLDGLNIHFSNIEELFGGYLLGVSKGHAVLFDLYSNQEISRRYTNAYQTLKANTMCFCPNSTFVFFINSNEGYSVYDALNERLICEEKLDRNISHLALSNDGKTMCTIENENLVLRKIPDFSIKEAPLWEMTSFKKTNDIMKEFEYAIIKEKETYELLNQKELKLDKIRENIKIVRNILEYENYLKLTALLSSKIGFHSVRIRTQFTNQNIEYYLKQDDHLIQDLYIQKAKRPHESVLYHSSFQTIINCPYDQILGISEDYCYLVCTGTKHFKYMLIELEWIN